MLPGLTAIMNSRPDEELVQALANGDENALRVLVNRYSSSIYIFSLRFTGDESIAEDICQEVFLRLFRHAGRYDPRKPFKTWLFTITRNASIDLARHYGYRRAHSTNEKQLSAEIQQHDQPLADPRSSPEEEYSSRERARKVAAALQALPVKQRTAIILKYYEHMSNREIAEVMKKSIPGVESLLIRGKHNLLRLLDL
jgi:RNA polymerase sigma-70 factor (ECF subfamily)